MQTIHSSVMSDHHFLTEDYILFLKISAKEYKASDPLRIGIPNMVTQGEDLGCQHHTYHLKISVFWFSFLMLHLFLPFHVILLPQSVGPPDLMDKVLRNAKSWILNLKKNYIGNRKQIFTVVMHLPWEFIEENG